MEQRHLDNEKAKLRLGKEFSDLPTITVDEFKSQVASGKCWVIVSDIVHNVETFVHEHPGGRQTLLNWVGTDVTRLFAGEDGSNHAHSADAHSYLRAMRVAKLNVECEE